MADAKDINDVTNPRNNPDDSTITNNNSDSYINRNISPINTIKNNNNTNTTLDNNTNSNKNNNNDKINLDNNTNKLHDTTEPTDNTTDPTNATTKSEDGDSISKSLNEALDEAFDKALGGKSLNQNCSTGLDSNGKKVESEDLFNQVQKNIPEKADEKPWWQCNIFFSSENLFGTWDGVFTTCLVNTFGVVIFIRMGWMLANVGLNLSILILLISESIALVTALSAIGICFKSQIICTGGVHTLISHIFGTKFATPISLIYTFGQAVSCSMCVSGFGEAILDLIGSTNMWLGKFFSCLALFFILAILLMGEEWVVAVQAIFVVVLFIAILDFNVGSFIRIDHSHGIYGYNWTIFKENNRPDFSPDETFFSVLAVFFPIACGILGGYSMSNMLKNPPVNIPAGTLSSIAVSTVIYLFIVLTLSATCQRSFLRHDFMIANKVSITHVLWLIGFYELSLSAAVGNLCGSPQTLYGIAADNVFGFLAPLAHGPGPKHVPLITTMVVFFVSFVFIFFGQLNELSRIVTIQCMITYSAVNLAYFMLSSTLGKNNKAIYESFDVTLATNDTDSRVVKKPEVLNETSLRKLFQKKIHGFKNEQSKQSKTDNVKIKLKNNHIIKFCNPWVSFIGAIVCFVSIFLIDWKYAFLNVIFVTFMWLFISMVNPKASTGISDFNIFSWIHSKYTALSGHNPKKSKKRFMVISEYEPIMDTELFNQNEANQDFSNRTNVHKVELIGNNTSFNNDSKNS